LSIDDNLVVVSDISRNNESQAALTHKGTDINLLGIR